MNILVLQKANFGPQNLISAARIEFERSLKDELPEILQRNVDRNPWRVIGPFMTAAGIAVLFWALRHLVEMTCAPWLDVCRKGSQLFAFIYSAIVLGMILIAYVHWGSLKGQFTAFVPVIQQLVNVARLGVGAVGQQSPQQVQEVTDDNATGRAEAAQLGRTTSIQAGGDGQLRQRRQA